jgi:hypothetical protein
MARSIGWFFATAALTAVLADLLDNLSGDLLELGISRPLNFRVLGRKTTLFRKAAIRPGKQHFVFPFRELNAAYALLCTPVTDASPNGVLLSTFSGRR